MLYNYITHSFLKHFVLIQFPKSERLNFEENQHQEKPKMAYQGPQKVQKVMVQPINLIFRFLQV